MKKLLFSGSEWDIPLVEKMWKTIDSIAKEKFNYYEPQIEIISSEQMLDAYSSVAMPIMYCVSGDTEFLTPTGWKQIKDYAAGDLVGQYLNGRLEFVAPLDYIETEERELYRFKNAGTEQLVSDNHKLVLQATRKNRVNYGRIKTIQASEYVYNSDWGVITTFKYSGQGLGYSENMLRLLVALKADGSIVDEKVQRFGLKKGRKIERLEKLLNLNGVSYTKNWHSDGLCSIRTKIPNVTSKRYEWKYSQVSFKDAKIIFDEIFYWDGCECYQNDLVHLTFSSKYKEDVDFLQYVAALIGYRGTVTKYKDQRAFQIYFSRSNTPTLGRVTENVKGKSYCFTVPSHMWISRLNGKIAVTGNSHWSFGKTFLQNERQYQKGQQGLAYEVVINTNPCLTYLMENNSATMQALVLCHAACVDSDTECLTDQGWIKISEYSGQKIAQYNDKGEISFKLPVRYIKAKTHKFYEVKARGISQKLTPDHRVVFKDVRGGIKEQSAEEFVDRHNRKTRGHTGKFITHFHKGYSTGYGIIGDHLRLQVAIKADASRQGKKYRFHLKKTRKIERLETLLRSLEIPYEKVDTCEGRVSIRFEYPGVPREYTWEEYMQWGNVHLEIVGDEVLRWDGDQKNCFSTTSKQSADVIQLVWASLGFGTSIYRHRVEGKKDCFKVSRCPNSERSISRSRGEVPNKIKELPGGKAYCFTTDTGMWVARRDDCIFVTGNCGHSHFFKNNYLFKDWTDADSILDYLKFAKNYVKSCEEKYGADRVEKLLDACHSLQNHGIDKYRKPSSLSKELKRQREKTWENYFESSFNDLWRTVRKTPTEIGQVENVRIGEENLLYFIEKNSQILEDWEKEIVRIVRKISQYFYPQRQTQLLNEGFASFTHHYLMTELHEQGYITDGSYLEFLQSHTAVVSQRDWDSKYYSGINPYALGFAMLTDIKRMCMDPDEEDLKWFPDICNTNWLETIKDIVANYRDESFILQFLSPRIARQFKLFSFRVDETVDYLEVNATHDDESFVQLRRALAEQYDLSRAIPQIEVVHVDWKDDRRIYLEHITKDNQRLDYWDMRATASYLHSLWGFNVEIRYKDLEGNELDAV
jgi:stage V sporulation protein R